MTTQVQPHRTETVDAKIHYVGDFAPTMNVSVTYTQATSNVTSRSITVRIDGTEVPRDKWSQRVTQIVDDHIPCW